MVKIKNNGLALLEAKPLTGFTLMEILVAMALLASVGATVMYSMSTAAKLAQPSPQRYTAYNLARQNSESLANAVRDDWWAGAGNPLSPTTDKTLAPTTYDGVSYAPRYTVVDVDVNNDSTVDYRKTDTKVQW